MYTVEETLAIEYAMSVVKNKMKCKGIEFNSVQVVKDFVFLKMSGLEHEEFLCLFLDNSLRLIEAEVMFRGTINESAVYPREIIKRALEHNAAAMIIAHNHPSGVTSPSVGDRNITETLHEALTMFDIRLLDHFIVGTDCYSFAENGLL